MCGFLIPLLLGFALNGASAFTAAFSRRWGRRCGTLLTLLLRVGLGMPLWVTGLSLAARAPGEPGLPAWLALPGWLAVLAGSGIMALALMAIRARAALPSTSDALVEHGLYARVRHPLYTGLLLTLAGLVLVRPTLLLALACALCAGWVGIQAWLEEYDLLQRVPGYGDYMRRVPRFVPHVRRPKS
jgi:protein-S-isoprenylcysteine O-methyltransferase Ste14